MKDAVALPSQIGVNATKLAIAGVVGCRDILDGPKGFWRMAGSDQCDFELMTAGIGKKYWLIDASYKTYSCCWFIHPALDAIGSIVQAQNLSWNDVQRIDVWSLTDLAEMFTDKGPTAMVDAQFSLPYCVAMKLLGIQSGPAWFEESRFSDCDVASITSRVHIYADKNADIIFQNSLKQLIKIIKSTEFGIFVDSGPLHLAKIFDKRGLFIETSVSHRKLLNNCNTMKIISNNFKSDFCNGPCGLTNLFNLNNEAGCFFSHKIKYYDFKKIKNINSLQRGKLKNNYESLMDNPVGCVKNIDLKKIVNTIKNEL